ncbi:hypothetical protein ACIPL1_27710 [Pseudomonas sp. NPDC090202]|uniref:hypothetical protein n=1 Tax=Pseudomonas sp. NPDC090202 TaxID=3364476 RepID=UPI0037FC69CF
MAAPQQPSLESLFTDRFKAFFASARPAEILDAGLERMLTDISKELFSCQGSFAGEVKKVISKALPGDLSSVIELPRYNDLIANAMKQRWAESGVTGDMLRRVNADIDEVLHYDAIPEFVSLTQLLESFIEVNQEKAAEKRWHVPHVLIREADGIGGRSRYIHVFFDAEPELAYRTRMNLHESTRTETEFANRISVQITGNSDRGFEYGKVITALIEGEPIGRNFNLARRWQKLMAAMYFGAAKLIIDCKESDFSYAP